MTLGEVAKVVSGYAFKSTSFVEVGTPVIKIANIRVNSVSFEDLQYVGPEFSSLPEKFRVQEGDILISLTGSHITQPNSVVGRVALYPKSVPMAYLNQRAGKVIVDNKKADQLYIYYWLSQFEIRKMIAQFAHGAASQANVSPSQIESIELDLPRLDIQKSIGQILKKYDDLIEINERKIKVLEEMARRIYREWFVDFKFPGHEKVNMIDSGHPDFGMIPEGWEVEEFAKVFDAKYGKGLPSSEIHSEGPYPVYGAGGEMGFYDHATTKQRVALIVCRGNGTGTIFRTREAAFVNNNSFMVVGHDACWKTSFIFEHLKVCRVEAAKSGSAQPQLTLDGIANLPILVPSVSLIESYQDFAESILDLVDCLVFTNRNLATQRNLLLPKLISGEINVTNISVDGIFDDVAKVASKSNTEGAQEVQTRSNH